MVLCEDPFCSTSAVFGLKKTGRAEFCVEHKRAGMVDVRSKMCSHHGCGVRPLFGWGGSTKAEFCNEHKSAGMVDVRHKRCRYPGCFKSPSYGMEGTKNIEFCTEHKKTGMVDVRKKRCAHQGCSVFPSFGIEGSRKTEFCSEHKRPGMVNVSSRKCLHQGCSVRPLYGTEGSRKSEFCRQHKKAGMVNVVSKRCAYQECFVRPFFGTEGSRTSEFCSEHKKEGMVAIRTKRCSYRGCCNAASNGKNGSKKTEFCTEHNTSGMEDVSNKKRAGESYLKYAMYGTGGGRRHRLFFSHLPTEVNHVGASALETAKSMEEGKEMEKDAALNVALPIPRKRALEVERFPRHVQKASEIPGSLDCGPSRGKRVGVPEKDKSNPSEEAEKIPGNLDCGPSRGKRVRVSENDKRNPSEEAEKIPGTLECGPSGGKRVRVPDDDKHNPSEEAEKTPERLDCGPSRGKRVRVPENDRRSPAEEAGKVPALRPESSSAPSPTAFTPGASQDGVDESLASTTQNDGRDDGTASREGRRSTVNGCRRDTALDIAPESCAAAATPAKVMRTEDVERTSEKDGEVAPSTGNTGSGDDALDCSGGRERVKAGKLDALTTSSVAGAERSASTTAIHGCRHTRASCPFALEDRRKMASMEEEKRDAVVEAKTLQGKVAQLQKEVADAVVGRACAVAEAVKEIEGKYTEIFQSYREELGAASKTLKDSNGAYDVVCKERDSLRQQVEKVEAQVASAGSKIDAEAAKTEKAKQDLQQRIEELRAELTASSMGWENTKDELKKIRQERDALHKEAQTKEQVGGAIAPGQVIPPHLLQSLVAGPTTVASPSALVAAAAPTRCSGEAQSSELPLPPTAAAPKRAVDQVVGEGEEDSSNGLRNLKNKAAGEVPGPPPGCVDVPEFAIKPEGLKVDDK